MRFRLIAFLFGAMLAVIPLILHLLSQRQGPRVYFPTLRFLKLCVHKTARRRRVENLLLLIFRMALLGLLAMALAEPFVPSTLAGSGPRDTVIILDNSYSMSTRELGTERFRTAKEIAADLLRSSERVSLIITSGPEADRFLHLLPVDNDLRSTVSNCRLFAGKADITAALTKAYNLLGDYGSTSARIFVLSDLQANSFPTVEDRLPSDRAPDVPVILYDCGRSAVRNAALVDLHARGGLGLSGSSVELVADVFNPSEVAINDLPVTVYLAGRPVADRRVSLPPRSRAKASFTVPLDAVSVQTGWIQLPPDSLEIDNRLNFRLALRPRIDVLLVRDQPGALASLDDAYFLARALDPRPKDSASQSPVNPRLALTSDLSRESLSGVSVVYLLNVRSLSTEAIAVLTDYVRKGGALCILPGPRSDLDAYTRFINPDPGKPNTLLHARLLSPVGDPDAADAAWKVRPLDFDHPFLARFKPLGAPIFERITVSRFFPLSVPGSSSARVLAGLVPADAALGEHPFLVEEPVGDGRVLFVACPATTAWSDLPAARIFVPLMHEIVYALAGSIDRLDTHQAGQPVRLDFPGTDRPVSIDVTLPTGAVKHFTSAPAPNENALVIAEPLDPGIYPFLREGGVSDAFVVNPDPAEADLARVTLNDLQPCFPPRRLYVAASADELTSVLDRIQGGVPLTSGLFLLVIAIAVLELFVANRTRPAQPEESPVHPFAFTPPREPAP